MENGLDFISNTNPVCFSGVVFSVYLTVFPLAATVIIGILIIVAITVNDGDILLTYASEIKEQEKNTLREAIVKAARIRLRPRIMTTMTTIMGFLPLSLNLTQGSDMLQPMAIAAIGELAMEMVVALFLMPCMYVMVTKKQYSHLMIKFFPSFLRKQ